MVRLARTIGLGALVLVFSASFADARGGGGGGGGGGGRGGGMGGGGGRGGMGGGGMGGRGGMGGAGGRAGGGLGGGRMGAGKKGTNDQKQQEQEDRKNLIEDRRQRLADADRAANQEARLALERLLAADHRVGDDVR